MTVNAKPDTIRRASGRQNACRRASPRGAEAWLPLALVLGAWVIRLLGLRSKGLWWDEGISVFLANLPLSEYWALRWMDIHPPLYRLALAGFVRLAGSSDLAVRSFSSALSLIAVPLVYLLGRRCLGTRGGLIAGALVAVSPLTIFHAREAKMYPLLLALVACTLLFAQRLLAGDDRPTTWLGYVGAATLALWTHYYAGTFLAAVNLAYAFAWIRRGPERPAPPRAWLLAQAGVGLAFLPWLLLDGSRLTEDADRTIGGVTLQPAGFAADIWRTLTVGYDVTAGGLAWTGSVAILALVLIGLLAAPVRQIPRGLLAATLFVPILLGVVISIRFPYNAPRFFIVCVPALAVLGAAGCDALFRRARWLGVTGAGAAVAVGLTGLMASSQAPSLTDDYRPLVDELLLRGRPDDLILTGYPWQAGYVEAYAPTFRRVEFPLPEDLDLTADREARVWVLYYQTPEGEPDYIRRRFESRGFRRSAARGSGQSRIAFYERP